MAALFGHGAETGSVRDWPRAHWDFGLIAENEDGQPIGAAWWRQFGGAPIGGEASTWREVFLAVDSEYQGQGLGGNLLDELIARARAMPNTPRLIGRIVEGDERARRIQQMLVRRDFVEDRTWARFPGGSVLWSLNVQ
ncbi:MAG: GNAT family N-acetyltransferase [Actinomycetota bacterium]